MKYIFVTESRHVTTTAERNMAVRNILMRLGDTFYDGGLKPEAERIFNDRTVTIDLVTNREQIANLSMGGVTKIYFSRNTDKLDKEVIQVLNDLVAKCNEAKLYNCDFVWL